MTKQRWTRLQQLRVIAVVLICLFSLRYAGGSDSARVTVDCSRTTPRAVEPLTERTIVRDYKFAWENLAVAMESSSLSPLNGLFAGTASRWLEDAINSQQRSGISKRLLNQNHNVEAVFYAPEGDVMELHDTADYDLEILDGGKAIHDEHVQVRYVVLMTPAADRWVVRQLQSVPQF
jgi:hypothetical protein